MCGAEHKTNQPKKRNDKRINHLTGMRQPKSRERTEGLTTIVLSDLLDLPQLFH